MTHTATAPGTATPASPAPAGAIAGRTNVSFPRIIRSEWIKLRSLRSTRWSFGIMVVLSLGLAALMAASAGFGSGQRSAAEQAAIMLQAATFGVFFGQMIVAVLGVLVISGEYSTGMIRSTLTAVPRRLPALWAKAIVLFVASFVVGLLSTIGAFLVASPFMATQQISASLFDSTVFLPLIGSAFYLGVVAVFGLGLGAILRSSAGGVAAALGLILLLPIVCLIAPIQWMHDTIPYLMMTAGLGSFGLDVFGGPSQLDSWQQQLVIVGWAAVMLIIGAVLLKRRDA